MVTIVQASWADAPHLSKSEQDRLEATIPAYQLKARKYGTPVLGAGAIYPIDEEAIKIKAFELPPYWPRGYGLDVGWNNTAAVWCARDYASDTVYVYDCYKRGQAEPASHIEAINARGNWIGGYIDPASAGSSQLDGRKLLDEYSRFLHVEPADNTVEAGIWNVYERMTTGRLKVFAHLEMFFEEFRLYRRDLKGKVVKEDDHLCDALRYACQGIQSWSVNTGGPKPKYVGST